MQPEKRCLHWYSVRPFHPYLFGRMLIARTDHNSLNWLHNFQTLKDKLLTGWKCYSYKLIPQPGSQHSNADAPSRLPCQQCGYRKLDEELTTVWLQKTRGRVVGKVHLHWSVESLVGVSVYNCSISINTLRKIVIENYYLSGCGVAQTLRRVR